MDTVDNVWGIGYNCCCNGGIDLAATLSTRSQKSELYVTGILASETEQQDVVRVRLRLPMELPRICRRIHERLHRLIYRWGHVHILCIQAQSEQTSTRAIYSTSSKHEHPISTVHQSCKQQGERGLVLAGSTCLVAISPSLCIGVELPSSAYWKTCFCIAPLSAVAMPDMRLMDHGNVISDRFPTTEHKWSESCWISIQCRNQSIEPCCVSLICSVGHSLE